MINYCVDYKGILKIFYDNYILYEISGCENMNEQDLNILVNEIIEEGKWWNILLDMKKTILLKQ